MSAEREEPRQLIHRKPTVTHAGYPGCGLARCGAPVGAFTVAPGEPYTCTACAGLDPAAERIRDWARSRVGEWTHVVELPAERIEVAGYRPEENPSAYPDTPRPNA